MVTGHAKWDSLSPVRTSSIHELPCSHRDLHLFYTLAGFDVDNALVV